MHIETRAELYHGRTMPAPTPPFKTHKAALCLSTCLILWISVPQLGFISYSLKGTAQWLL